MLAFGLRERIVLSSTRAIFAYSPSDYGLAVFPSQSGSVDRIQCLVGFVNVHIVVFIGFTFIFGPR